MCTMKDITKAVTIFKKYSCPFILMHCVSEYPCPEEKLNLNMIKTLKKDLNAKLDIVAMNHLYRLHYLHGL